MIARSVTDRLSHLAAVAAGLALVLLVVSPLVAAVPPHGGATSTSPRTAASTAPGTPASPVASKDPVVARVEGKAIRLGEVEMLRDKNLDRYKQQTGRPAPRESEPFFLRAGLEEAIRRRLLELDASERGMKVSDAAAESLMRADPFFQTKGAFDTQRFASYRAANPQGFGLARDEARAILLSQERMRQLQREFTPTPAEIDARARFKTTQARVRYTLVTDVHYDPDYDPTDDELRALYTRDKASLTTPAEVRYTTALLVGSDHAVTARAADSLLARVMAGAPFDSVLRAPGIAPGSQVWRTGVKTGILGTNPALAESLVATTPPYVLSRTLDAPDGTVLLRVDAARPASVPPLSRIATDVRARWRADRMEAAEKTDIRAYYAAHPDSFVVPGWQVRWALVDSTRIHPAAPSADELKAWFAGHQTEFARLDPTGGGIQMRTLEDVRPQAIERWKEEERTRRARSLADGAAAAWAKGGSAPSDPALAAGGPAWLVANGAIPPGLAATLADSVRGWTAAPHTLVAPDPVGFAVVALVRYDPGSHAPLESVEPRVRALLEQQKVEKDRALARAWFDQQPQRFRTGPGYEVIAVTAPMPTPAQVEVPEADVARYYKEHMAEFGGATQVHVRHILVGLDRHSEAEAHSIAAQVLSRARRGEDFAQLAAAFSEDPGTKDKGGDLGYVKRGELVPAFEAVAFGLTMEKPLSSVVRTQFGFHVIQLLDRKEGSAQSLADATPEIGRRLASAYADTVSRKAAERLRVTAKSAAELTQISADRDLPSQIIRWYDGLELTGVATLDELRHDAVGVKPGGLLPSVYRYGAEGYVAVGLDTVLAPQQQTFEQAEQRVMEEWRREGRVAAARRRADRFAHDLASGVPWDKAIETVGGETPSGPFSPGQNLPTLGETPGLDSLVFGPGADTLKTGGWARLPSERGDVFVHLDERIPADPAALREARESVAGALLNRRVYEYVEALRAKHPVTVLRSDLAVRIPPPPLD